MTLHQPEWVLLDEPSNHLDGSGRKMLYEWVTSAHSGMIAVSHDRQLLQLLPRIYELTPDRLIAYGGNFHFYQEQKQTEAAALDQHIRHAEKTLRKAKEKDRIAKARQQKLDARGKKKTMKAGVAGIMRNTLKNQAEQSTSKTEKSHSEKVESTHHELRQFRDQLPDADKIKISFASEKIHTQKVMIDAHQLNVHYRNIAIWSRPLTFQINYGERIALKGANGSGKTTLMQLISGQIKPTEGNIRRADFRSVYVDQDYALVSREESVLALAASCNTSALPDHELKIRLTHFLFSEDDWAKPTQVLSGGEKMRLLLCCLTLQEEAPELILLDEPTNNLDLQNTELLAAALRRYQGTLIIISHDEMFLNDSGVTRHISL